MLLIRPDIDFSSVTLADGAALVSFLNNNDISVSVTVSPSGGAPFKVKANSLADLTRPENRFAHWFNKFPHQLNLDRSTGLSLYNLIKSGSHLGEDVMMANALAFDVQVFDHDAPLYAVSGELLVPSDIGWPPPAAAGAVSAGSGAFVDLGYGARTAPAMAGASNFSGVPTLKSGMRNISGSPFYCYDTWSMHFERDGVDQFGDGDVDLGTNGLDDDGLNGVDDANERETSPPYPVPLRGAQISIRVYEPDSRQVRQATVVSGFVPE
jgi:hypothetical protein